MSDTNTAIDETTGASSAMNPSGDATKGGPGATEQPSGATKAPERVTVEVAVGPNTEGLDHMVRGAHGVDAPDPANQDDTGEFAEPAAPVTPQPTE